MNMAKFCVSCYLCVVNVAMLFANIQLESLHDKPNIIQNQTVSTIDSNEITTDIKMSDISEKTEKKRGFYATYAEQYKWEYGSTLLGFLVKNKIPEKIYYNLSVEDKELIADVKTDSEVFILRDMHGKILQAFLPLNSDTQIRIFYNFEQEQYAITIIPILSLEIQQKVVAKIQDGGGPSSALYGATQDSKLNQEFIAAYKLQRIVQKGDRIAMTYIRKYRLGKPIGIPEIQSIGIESNKTFSYIFGYKNRYYDINGKEMTSFFLMTPVKYRRISSKFSSGRKHPVLGYTRPHYGVDYAAASGTPIYAAGEGRISFAGIKGGYGKVVEINHAGGIKTLYAHMSKIAKNSKVGTYVRQGTYIGNVGSTGLSTGPHLHFGVYRSNKPINPLGQIRTARSELSGKNKIAFKKFANKAKSDLEAFVNSVSFGNNSFVVIKTLVSDQISEDSDEDVECIQSRV